MNGLERYRYLIGTTIHHREIDWRVASVHGHPTMPWAWIVNMRNKNEQARLPLSADAFQ